MSPDDNPFFSSDVVEPRASVPASTSGLLRGIRFTMAMVGLGAVVLGCFLSAFSMYFLVTEWPSAGGDTARLFGVLWGFLCLLCSGLTAAVPGLVALGGLFVGGSVDDAATAQQTLTVHLWVWRLIAVGGLVLLVVLPVGLFVVNFVLAAVDAI